MRGLFQQLQASSQVTGLLVIRRIILNMFQGFGGVGNRAESPRHDHGIDTFIREALWLFGGPGKKFDGYTALRNSLARYVLQFAG